ncbi:MAG: hypothetical protein JSS00_05710 [Proteobacteria bacterium]|nr:hypothetical protein [Pseudomonadota bacterium]
MRNRLFAAALAAAALAAGALPAAAQDFRGDAYRGERYQQDFRGDWRLRAQITVRQDGRQVSFDRGDRAFYRLMDSPFNFQPGLTYVYTDRCWRDNCVVLAFSPWSRGPAARMWAPRLGRFFFYAGGRDGRFDGRGDGRWYDRGDDGRFDGDRNYRGDRGDDRSFQDSPR